MSLQTLNFNLLPVLRALLRHRSITEAGLALGRSPSAVSQGLSQLRTIFNDALLVRAAGGMVLTPRAEELIEPVELALAQVERVLHVEATDPAQADRQFVIAATDYDTFAHGPALVDAIHAAGPHIKVRFVNVGRDLHDRILDRDVDLALLPDFLLLELASDKLRQRVVAKSRTQVMMAADHPLRNKAKVTPNDLDQETVIGFFPSWESTARRKSYIVSRQPGRALALTPQILSIPHFILGSNRVALAPERLVEDIGAPLGLIGRPLAAEEPVVRSVIAWGAPHDADPIHRWFRDTAGDGVLADETRRQTARRRIKQG